MGRHALACARWPRCSVSRARGITILGDVVGPAHVRLAAGGHSYSLFAVAGGKLDGRCLFDVRRNLGTIKAHVVRLVYDT